jgi:hypothetical protein
MCTEVPTEHDTSITRTGAFETTVHIYGVRFQDETILTAITVKASSLASGKYGSFSVKQWGFSNC